SPLPCLQSAPAKARLVSATGMTSARIALLFRTFLMVICLLGKEPYYPTPLPTTTPEPPPPSNPGRRSRARPGRRGGGAAEAGPSETSRPRTRRAFFQRGGRTRGEERGEASRQR